MGNQPAKNTCRRAEQQGEVDQNVKKYMSQYDASKTGTLSREEVKALASDLLTQYTPLLGGITDEDVDLIMCVGGSNVQCEISAEQLPQALAIICNVREKNQEFVELFEKYDTDNTGVLPVEQLGPLLVELNEGLPVASSDITYVLNQCEPRGQADAIGKTQLKAALACWWCLEPGIEDNIKKMFKKWDTDGTGCISQDEMTKVFTSLDPNITKEQVALIYASVDVNGNGKLEYDEFVNWVMEGGISVGGVHQDLKGKDPNIIKDNAGAPSAGAPAAGAIGGTEVVAAAVGVASFAVALDVVVSAVSSAAIGAIS